MQQCPFTFLWGLLSIGGGHADSRPQATMRQRGFEAIIEISPMFPHLDTYNDKEMLWNGEKTKKGRTCRWENSETTGIHSISVTTETTHWTR